MNKSEVKTGYQCEHCEAPPFKNPWGLRVHMARLHKGIPIPDEINTPRKLKKNKLSLTINGQRKSVQAEVVEETNQVVLPDNFSFCSCCGDNIRMQIIAKNVANKMRGE